MMRISGILIILFLFCIALIVVMVIEARRKEECSNCRYYKNGECCRLSPLLISPTEKTYYCRYFERKKRI